MKIFKNGEIRDGYVESPDGKVRLYCGEVVDWRVKDYGWEVPFSSRVFDDELEEMNDSISEFRKEFSKYRVLL